jgi:hypothetical protein
MSSDQTWRERDVAERKVLINAMEEGYVCELLPPSFIITASGGREQDFPSLPLAAARTALERLAVEGLVGTYILNRDGEFVGVEAVASVADDGIWTAPASGGLCLFLTEAGARAVGIR